MLRVQCPMQFCGTPRNITYVQHRFLQENSGSTNTIGVAFHALLLPFKHY